MTSKKKKAPTYNSLQSVFSIPKTTSKKKKAPTYNNHPLEKSRPMKIKRLTKHDSMSIKITNGRHFVKILLNRRGVQFSGTTKASVERMIEMEKELRPNSTNQILFDTIEQRSSEFAPLLAD